MIQLNSLKLLNNKKKKQEKNTFFFLSVLFVYNKFI
jgi:hypothetical protein